MTTNNPPFTGNTATVPQKSVSNGRNRGGEKETTDTAVLVVATGEEIAEVVDVRWYMARRSDGASPVYCSVWIRSADGETFAGNSKAGGYGYCKRSAAFHFACASAGIKLASPVDGRGMSAVHAAMHAIANAAGYADQHVRRIV